MKFTSKRLVSILLVLAFALALLPVAAFAEGETVTVYYYNATNWGSVKVYFWGSASNNPGWPGYDMTDLGNGYWSYEIPADIIGKEAVIFNNGSGSQTSNLTVPASGENCFDGSNWIVYTGESIEVVIDYYLRGSMNGWTADESNKMTKQDDGTYAITMDLAAGSYEYKAAVADWSWSCPSGANASLTLDADDTATFTLDVTANTLTVSLANAGEITVDYYVVGDMNGWAQGEAGLMTANEDGTYSVTMAVAAGNYGYKVNNTAGEWIPGGDNLSLIVLEDCDVTFVLNTDGSITASGDGVASEVVLGDNTIGLGKYIFTATEDGTLTVDVTTLAAYNEESGAMESMNVMMASRMFTLEVNGMTNWMFTNSVEVKAGDVVTISLSSMMISKAEATMNLSIAEPGAADIKWQLNADASAEAESVDLRLISWVDSLDYSKVTFNVTIDGQTAELDCTTVYTAINADGNVISDLSIFNDYAAYFVTYTIEGLTAEYYNSEIEVTVSWTDLDGYVTTSETRTIVVADDWA